LIGRLPLHTVGCRFCKAAPKNVYLQQSKVYAHCGGRPKH